METYDAGWYQRGCIVGLLAVVLAIGATVVSMNYYQPRDPVTRTLTAGFPMTFLVDYDEFIAHRQLGEN